MAKDLSEDGTFKVNQLRNRIYDTLYAIVKELRGNCATAATIASPASQFGNLLLFLPIVTVSLIIIIFVEYSLILLQ